MRSFLSRFKAPHFVFAILALMVIQPFRPGYFFLLDYVAYPAVVPTWSSFFSAPLGWFVVNTLNPFLFSAAVSQKLTLVLALFLLGMGGFKLAERYGTGAAYFSGIFAVLNPFVYSRLLDGQIGPILSLFMLLWGVFYFNRYHETSAFKNAAIASAFFGLAVGFMIHSVFMTLLIFFVFFTIHLPRKEQVLRYGLNTLASIGIMILINLNWLISQWFASADEKRFFTDIVNADHFAAFLSGAGESNIYFNTLSLHGYWGEGASRFLSSTFFIERWSFVFTAIFFLVILGIIYGMKEKETQKLTFSFILLAGISYVLSMGIASPHFGFITQWLYDHLPFYKGFREPQKWSAILLISYLYFSAIGLRAFLEWKFVRSSKKLWTGIALALPVFYTFSMLLGFMGQLKTSDYPPDWYQFRAVLSDSQIPSTECKAKKQHRSENCYEILAFPWHQYMHFGFAGRIIANPLRDFFRQARVLQGDNVEIGKIYSQSRRPESDLIQKYVGPGLDRTSLSGEAFLNELDPLGIRYLLVAKTADWENYDDFLKSNPALKIFWDSETLRVYERFFP